MARLSKNEVIKTIDGKDIKVLEFLGAGGQGTVYKVNYEGKKYLTPRGSGLKRNMINIRKI